MITFVPVPAYKDGRPPKTSSGFMSSDRPDHVGVDIMYPRLPEDGGPPDQNAFPTYSRRHYMPAGVPVLAWADGQVMESSQPSKGGYVVLEHPGGFRTQYMHLARRDVHVGQQMKAGQQIGIVGADPTVANPRHVHFQLRKNGILVDPGPYLSVAKIAPWPTSPLIYVGLAGLVVGGVWLVRERLR